MKKSRRPNCSSGLGSLLPKQRMNYITYTYNPSTSTGGYKKSHVEVLVVIIKLTLKNRTCWFLVLFNNDTKRGTVRGSGLFKYLGSLVAADGGCERDMVHRMYERYRGRGALKSAEQ